MIKSMRRFVTLAAFLTALIAVSTFTPVVAMDGGGGGDPAASTAIYPAPSHPPSSHPGRWGTKATHKVKKTTRQSSIRPPGI
jgi:hypothetical protein